MPRRRVTGGSVDVVRGGGRAQPRDGVRGIGEATIAEAAEAGADTFVAGSAVFGAADPDAAIAALRASAARAHRHR